jgi:hypothetical protein
LLEDYLVTKTLQKNERDWLLQKQGVLLEHKCYKAFQYVSHELEEKLKSGLQESDVHLLHHEWQNLNLEYSANHKKRNTSLPFSETMDELDRFYIAKKLKLAAEVINAQNILSSEHSLRLLNEVKDLAGKDEFSDSPSIQMYLSVLNTLTDPQNEDHFEMFYHQVSLLGNKFSYKEQRGFFHYLKNYCIKKVNTGEVHYLEKLFMIYKLNLSDPHLFKDEALSPWEYKNIVSIGLRLGHDEWVHSFIHEYNRFLEPQHQENAMIYNMANWNFHQKNYHDTLSLFQKVEFTDIYYQLDLRAILLKIYFEMNDEETLFYQASSFRSFLSRNKLVSNYQRKIYRNMISFTVKMQRCGTNLKKLNALLTEIRTKKNTADITWLEKKIRELL